MLLDTHFFLENPLTIILLTFGVYALKSAVVTLASLFLGIPMRTAVMAGMALGQVGEFSFVLAMSGISYNIGTEYLYQLFLAVAVFTMGMTPTLISLSPKIANLALKLPFSAKIKSGLPISEVKKQQATENHIIIVGYGFQRKKPC